MGGLLFQDLFKHTITTSMTLYEKPCSMFSILPKTGFNFSVTFILLSANAFNLDQSKDLLFGQELKQIVNDKGDSSDRICLK